MGLLSKQIFYPLITYFLTTYFFCALKKYNKGEKDLSIFREPSLNIMSFNIRYNNSADGKNAWPNRRDIVTKLIKNYKVDLFGIQESLKDQIDDLAVNLPNYKWFGKKRDNSKLRSEFVPIFYDKNRLEQIEHSTFWLSKDINRSGSIGWDAKHSRIVTWGKFKDKISNKIFYHFNTHFDKQGHIAREKSAKLLIENIEKIAKSNPVVVTGDFNCTESSIPYNILTSGKTNDGKSINGKLRDTYFNSLQSPIGPYGTINDFKDIIYPDRRIDYIFIKNNVKVIKHMTIGDKWNNRFPSDHLPILVEVVL